jgi:hypothetical protein
MLAFTDEVAPYDIPFEAYGVEVRVCSNDVDLLERARPFLPPGAQRRARGLVQHRLGILLEPDGTHSVYNGTTRVSEGQGRDLSLIVLEGQIRGIVALHAPRMTFVHAGAVAHEGRAMIFPGHSFAGKTTLVAALVRAGATYYSDEFAVLDENGLVHPYAKPLSIRDGTGLSQADRDVEDLGGVAGDEPLALGLMVVTSYRPGARWAPEELSQGQASLALLASTVSVRARPKAAMRAATRALTGAVALRGERGDADEVADQLLELVRS